MNKSDQIHIEDMFASRIRDFQKLMKFKIRDILLVSSLYDYFLFEEEGKLYELIRQEYQVLNLSQAPEITHVTTGGEALEVVGMEDHFDLVIVTLHIQDMHPVKFTQMLRQAGHNMPVVLLAYDNRERKEMVTHYDGSIFDRIFIWQGDYHLLIAMIKSIEDKFNVEHDTETVGVQSIILVEDNVKFYSSYLPLIYREIFDQSLRLISEGINLTHKFLRMRARPKILLCTNYEEAWECFEKYKDNILGVITDNTFRLKGVKDSEAGIKFAQRVKEAQPDIPILVQSSNEAYAAEVKKIGVAFVHKGSQHLLHELRDYMLNNFGFGDFVFTTEDGVEVGRANNLNTFEEQLKKIPAESIKYHASRNHFSKWLKARTEFWLAHRLRPQKVTDFISLEALRREILQMVRMYKDFRQRGMTIDYNKDTFDPKYGFAQLGTGSLGGKARGLSFINNLLNNTKLRESFDGIEIFVPSAVVIATDIFDRFMKENNLEYFALSETMDEEILNRFLHAPHFPPEVITKLRSFLALIKDPLAVRSSSLLEDSQFQPFAGVYDTYMIPNNNADIEIRLKELLQSIRCVYASTFLKKARDYVKSTEYGLEEEKMAVIIQTCVGTRHESRFYPDFAGVGKSYNFYPVSPQKTSDGITYVGLGLGKLVVEGGNSIRFCPKYPKHMLQFFSAKETMKNSQRKFYALDLDASFDLEKCSTPANLVQAYDLSVAEKDGTLQHVASTYSVENETVYDGISRNGPRIVTFAPVLKQKIFPLSEILNKLLPIGSWGMGTQVEIEFAVRMNDGTGVMEFAMLQMRPLVITFDTEPINIEEYEPKDLLCESPMILGNGIMDNLYDVIVVDYHKFERGKSRDVAAEVRKLNSKLIAAKKPYLLIGVGRWGSLDPWLGIPITWDQISGASVIIESGFKDFAVTPSQGSHFFQNLTAFRVGYFTVNTFQNLGYLDWDWLLSQKPVEEMVYTRHIEFASPLIVKLNGHQGLGVVLKPKEH
jgi:CheY-like chemotaxis protein